MNTYIVIIEDIYDKSKTKKIEIKDSTVHLAHKAGLKKTNALREEIVKITKDGRAVYTLKSGFFEE
jgi:hypothetical protein